MNKTLAILKIISYAVLGGILGFILFSLLSAGFFTRWQLLDIFSDEKIKLVGAVESGVYTLIDDSEYYYCSPYLEECSSVNFEDVRWDLIQAPPPAYAENRSSCDTSLPEFFFLLNPVKEPVDCHQVFMYYDDGSGRGTFVVNTSGELWGWFHIGSSIDTQFEIIYYPLVTAILFVILGIALGVLKNKPKG